MLSQNRTSEGKNSRRAGDFRAIKAACGLHELRAFLQKSSRLGGPQSAFRVTWALTAVRL